MNKFYKPVDEMSVVDMFFTFNVCNEFYFCTLIESTGTIVDLLSTAATNT